MCAVFKYYNYVVVITEEVVAIGDSKMTQYAVLCSEVLCKVSSNDQD